jgi:hypothetical protein
MGGGFLNGCNDALRNASFPPWFKEHADTVEAPGIPEAPDDEQRRASTVLRPAMLCVRPSERLGPRVNGFWIERSETKPATVWGSGESWQRSRNSRRTRTAAFPLALPLSYHVATLTKRASASRQARCSRTRETACSSPRRTRISSPTPRTPSVTRATCRRSTPSTGRRRRARRRPRAVGRTGARTSTCPRVRWCVMGQAGYGIGSYPSVRLTQVSMLPTCVLARDTVRLHETARGTLHRAMGVRHFFSRKRNLAFPFTVRQLAPSSGSKPVTCAIKTLALRDYIHERLLELAPPGT